MSETANSTRLPAAPAGIEGTRTTSGMRSIRTSSSRNTSAPVSVTPSWSNQAPAYPPRDERLLVILRDFELAYDAYAEFQRGMERYWCLRWLTRSA